MPGCLRTVILNPHFEGRLFLTMNWLRNSMVDAIA